MKSVFAEENYIAVRGKGVVSILPDSAVLRLSVRTEGKNTEEAKKENDRLMEETLKKLEELGVEKENIKISRYKMIDFSKDYGYNYPGNEYWETKRYFVENKIQVITKDLEGVPALIDNIEDFKEGITTEGFKKDITTEVSFAVSNSKEHYKKALDLAVKNANQNASNLASSLGIKIGAPSIVEIYNLTSWDKTVDSSKGSIESSFANSYEYIDAYETDVYFTEYSYAYSNTSFSAYIQIVVEVAATYPY